MNNEFDLNWPYRFGQPTQSALLKAEPADFQVFEDLGFMPSGQGEHLFVRIRKTGETPHLGVRPDRRRERGAQIIRNRLG